MKNIGVAIAIQKFTSILTQKPFTVNVAGLQAVYSNDGSMPLGTTFKGAGAVLAFGQDTYIPVVEDYSKANELWLAGATSLHGTAWSMAGVKGMHKKRLAKGTKRGRKTAKKKARK